MKNYEISQGYAEQIMFKGNTLSKNSYFLQMFIHKKSLLLEIAILLEHPSLYLG